VTTPSNFICSTGSSGMTYDYDRQRIGSNDLHKLLQTFESIVDTLAKNERRYKERRDDWIEQIQAGAEVRAALAHVKRHGIERLFWGLIQGYQMEPKDRKVIERASKAFSKSRLNRIRPEKAMETYEATLKEYRLFLETVKRVLNRGNLHTEDSSTVVPVGCITLINAGGFSTKQMGDVKKVVENAVRKLKARGLSKVCYGTAQVTNQLRQGRVLAFYQIDSDQLFIRGNLKGKQGLAESVVIHELGHRLHRKFLMSKNDEIKSIYKRLKGDHREAIRSMMRDPNQHPKPGSEFTQGRTTYVFGEVFLTDGYEEAVRIHDKADPAKKGHIKLKNWFKYEGGAFVSQYASTSFEENFAEMIAHYCQGTLPDDQVRMLETVLS